MATIIIMPEEDMQELAKCFDEQERKKKKKKPSRNATPKRKRSV